jgi:predicted ATPase
MADRAPYIFISYASADRERVLEIVGVLREAGISCWLDQHGIEGGANWARRIAEAIEGCTAMVLASSATSLASRNVRQEVALAWKYARPYLPLLLDTTPIPQEIEYYLEGSQWIEVFGQPAAVWLPRVQQALARLGVEHVDIEPAPTSAPSVATLPSPPLSVPAPLTATVGRDAEIAEISARLQSARLLTLLGPGGTGKTRLAQEVARRTHGAFPGGVVWVDLAPISDPTLVLPAVAAALGVTESATEPLAQTLARAIGARRLLLVLDNIEQVAQAAVDLSGLLEQCPQLRLLVTSRVALRLRAEHGYPVPPLALPEANSDPDRLLENEAVALFVQRAAAARPAFALTVENATTVAAICHRLDGLPLALELAAARIRVLTPQVLLERLDRPLNILSGGARDLPERQQTIRRAIQWSYDLLAPNEQRLFRRLAVFVDGWTLEAAEAVIHEDSDPATGSGQAVMDGLLSLVEQSLVVEREQPDGAMRFGMLEAIREFAAEQLNTGDEADMVRQRHAAEFARLAVNSEAHRRATGSLARFREIDREYQNVRAALDWQCGTPGNGALITATELSRYWEERGYSREGCQWIERALRVASDVPATLRAAALTGMAGLQRIQGKFDEARHSLDQAVSLCDEQADPRGAANTLHVYGALEASLGRYDEARRHSERSLDLRRRAGDDLGAASTLSNLGAVCHFLGDYEQAECYYHEAMEVADATGNEVAGGTVRMNLAELAYDRGDYDRARRLGSESIDRAEQLGSLPKISFTSRVLARLELTVDDPYAAYRYISRSLRIDVETGRLAYAADDLRVLLDVLLALRRDEDAALALGAMNTLRDQLGTPLAAAARDEVDAVRVRLTETLGVDHLAARLQHGAGIRLSNLIDELLPSRAEQSPPQSVSDSPSAR